jgi:soluble lytic murein transglycosylase-like protein
MKFAMLRGLSAMAAAMVLLVQPCYALVDDSTNAAAASISIGVAIPELQATFSMPEPATSAVPWYQHIQKAAVAYGVDVHLLHAIVQVESNFNTNAVSRSGAIGLMQIMPVTAAGFIGLRGTRQSLSLQLQDPAINVHAGALYMRSLMDTFAHRLDLALAAYNAGTGNVRKAGNRVPPNGETPQFVKKVTAIYASLKAAALAEDVASAALAATEASAQGVPLPAPIAQ